MTTKFPGRLTPALSASSAAAAIRQVLSLAPFALFLIILPFPGTVAARLLFLFICFGSALWQWRRLPAARAPIPCKAALGAWMAVCLASLAYAFDAAYTLGELKNEVGYSMMAYFAFFVVAHDRGNALWLLRASGLGSLAIGSWALFALVGNDFHWNEGGGHGGIGVFATYVITVVPALAWLSCEDSSPLLRRIAAGLSVFAMFLAAVTMQRAVWPVLALQLVLALAMATRAGLIKARRRLLLIAVGLVAAAALAGLVAIQQIRYGDARNEQVQLNTDVRIAFWPRVIARIVEHPLTGTGFGRGVIHKAYPDLTPEATPALWHAHNVLLNYGLEMGFPGIVVLASLFAAFGILFWRASAGPSALAGIAGFVIVASVLARNQFNDFFMRDMSLMFWALAGLFARLTVAARQGNSNDQQRPA